MNLISGAIPTVACPLVAKPLAMHSVGSTPKAVVAQPDMAEPGLAAFLLREAL
jgi:hypothetical protein